MVRTAVRDRSGEAVASLLGLITPLWGLLGTELELPWGRARTAVRENSNCREGPITAPKVVTLILFFRVKVANKYKNKWVSNYI